MDPNSPEPQGKTEHIVVTVITVLVMIGITGIVLTGIVVLIRLLLGLSF